MHRDVLGAFIASYTGVCDNFEGSSGTSYGKTMNYMKQIMVPCSAAPSVAT